MRTRLLESLQEHLLLSDDKTFDKGFFFVLEGIDGSGKTTVCDRLETVLQNEGYDVVRLREPTNESPWGQEIRERSPRGELSPEEELELFIRDREWHVINRILPSLNDKKVVLLDRYFFATGAYQSVVTGIDWREILRRNREEIGAPDPDLLVVLDIPAEIGLRRATGRLGEANLQFEKLERLVRVRQVYLEIAREDNCPSVVVDAAREIDEVVAVVYREVIRVISYHERGDST